MNALLSKLIPRRDFLFRGAGLAAAAVHAPALLGSPNADAVPNRGDSKARTCIFVYLLGGPPHLDMWDLKPNAPAEVRGSFRPISTCVPGLQVCEHLPRLAEIANRYSLVRSVS